MYVVPPEQYLTTFRCGSELKEKLFTSTLPVDDLIAYCKEVGYVNDDVTDQDVPKIGNHIPTLTIASFPSQHNQFKGDEGCDTNRSITTSRMLSSVSPSPQYTTRPLHGLRGPLPPSMPFYNISAGAHGYSPPTATYYTHKQPNIFADDCFPFNLLTYHQPTPLSQPPAPVPTNIDPRLMLHQEPSTSFVDNTTQALPNTSSSIAMTTDAARINDLSSFNTNNYNQHLLPNGSDGFL